MIVKVERISDMKKRKEKKKSAQSTKTFGMYLKLKYTNSYLHGVRSPWSSPLRSDIFFKTDMVMTKMAELMNPSQTITLEFHPPEVIRL